MEYVHFGIYEIQDFRACEFNVCVL